MGSIHKETSSWCKKCKQDFVTEARKEYHVRREHQDTVRVRFSSSTVTGLKRGLDGEFKCRCGKGFTKPQSLRRHAITCQETGHAFSEHRTHRVEELEEGGRPPIGCGELESIGLTVNQEYGMLVCHRCHVVTRKEHVLTHISSKHGTERSKVCTGVEGERHPGRCSGTRIGKGRARG